MSQYEVPELKREETFTSELDTIPNVNSTESVWHGFPFQAVGLLVLSFCSSFAKPITVDLEYLHGNVVEDNII